MADTKVIVFQVHSVVFANSGTILLCLVDTTGHISSMRQEISKAFPGLFPAF